MLAVDQEYSWQLPEIDEGSYAILDVEVSVPVRLSSYITFDEDLRQFTYDGNGISDSIGGQFYRFEIKLVDEKQEVTYS